MERKGLGDRKILIFHDVGRFSCINVVEPSKTREFVSMFVREKAQKEKQNSIYTSIHGKKERKEGRPRLPENPVNRGRGRNRNDVGGIANLSAVLENGCGNAMPIASLWYFPVNLPYEATTKPHFTHALATLKREKRPKSHRTKRNSERHKDHRRHT